MLRDAFGPVGPHDAAGAEKHQRLVQRVIEHVVERAGDAERAAEAEAERDDAHVLDAGIGHQPLDARLADDEKRGDEKGKPPSASSVPRAKVEIPAASATAR